MLPSGSIGRRLGRLGFLGNQNGTVAVDGVTQAAASANEPGFALREFAAALGDGAG